MRNIMWSNVYMQESHQAWKCKKQTKHKFIKANKNVIAESNIALFTMWPVILKRKIKNRV